MPPQDVADPPRPLTLDSTFLCVALRGTLTVRACVTRQAASRRQRNKQTSRGQAGSFPSCTHRCAQGAELRRAVPGALAITWRGSGPGGRFERERCGMVEAAARRRLEAVGLLDEVPTIDRGPGRWDDGPEDPYSEAGADAGRRRDGAPGIARAETARSLA